jgi:curved DNA-binding protein CbpA
MPDAIDPYKTLQVDPEAEDEVITAAYRRLARKYHPDLAGTPDASARMAAINAAWELIGDPVNRATYDRLRRASLARSTASEGAFGRGGAGASTGWGGAAGSSGSAGWAGSAGSGGRGAGSAGSGPGGSGGSGGSGAGSSGAGAGIRPEAASGGAGGSTAGSAPSPPPAPDVVSRDWTSGRSSLGGGFDESMRAPQGHAGPPPGRPSGRVLNFGRFAGWSLGEIARQDLEYLEWLDRMPIGRPYRDEIDGFLRAAGRRRSEAREGEDRRGLYRRR